MSLNQEEIILLTGSKSAAKAVSVLFVYCTEENHQLREKEKTHYS